MNGVLIVDKEIGKTSFDVIRDIRKKYNMKKVGHTGTLDPMASGVLPILLGDATRLSDYLMNHDKEYIAILKLGEKTDTGDSEGKIVEIKQIPNIPEKEIIQTISTFIGEINQIPPMYSAIKVNGEKLYNLARQGKEIEREARKVNIYDINNIKIKQKESEIEFTVKCSKGTYIRTLCEDIARALGTCGYMKYLRRTKVGRFTLEDVGKCIEIEQILENEPKYNLKQGEKEKILNGVKIRTELKNGLVRIYDEGKFLGVGEVENKNLKRKIISPTLAVR